MTILHLIDALDCNGSTRQLTLLAPALTQQACRVEVCCLGRLGPWSTPLAEAGVPVHGLNWTRWFDPGALWKLRQLLQVRQPALIHVWRLPALRALGLVAPELLDRVVVSDSLPDRGGLSWWDRWLLRQVRCLTVAGANELAWSEQVGLEMPRQVIPAAVAPAPTPRSSAWLERFPRRIVCVGRLEPQQGFREAIWTADILFHRFDDLHLLIVGTGPSEAALRAQVHHLEDSDRIHFLGERADVAEVLGSADVCWVPSLANRGRQAALEAMALGRPVVASDVPCLRDLIVPGQTGYLVPPGQTVGFARATRTLLLDADLRDRVGQAARQAAEEHYSLARVTHLWHSLYNNLAA